MLYSKSAHASGGSGFFLDEDKTSPADVIPVSKADASTAVNLQAGSSYEFDNGGNLIVITPSAPTAAQIKAKAATAKWEAIKAERDRRTENGGFKVGTKWFHSDQKSRTQQIGLVMLGANIPANTPWKTMDGTTVTMTQALAGQIFATAAASDIAIFAAAETHKAAMEASADPASYDFAAGWPKIFGE